MYELAEGNTWRVSQGEASAFETRTENDLALAYKLQVSSVANNSRYDEIVRAFRAAGITKEELNEAKLKQWDSEWLALCQNAVETIKKLKGEDALGGQNTLIGRFKTGNDGSNYLGWGWISAKTNSELLNIYQSELTQVQERIKFNTQDTKW